MFHFTREFNWQYSGYQVFMIFKTDFNQSYDSSKIVCFQPYNNSSLTALIHVGYQEGLFHFPSSIFCYTAVTKFLNSLNNKILVLAHFQHYVHMWINMLYSEYKVLWTVWNVRTVRDYGMQWKTESIISLVLHKLIPILPLSINDLKIQYWHLLMKLIL